MILLIESCSQTHGDSLVNTIAQLLQLDTSIPDCDGLVSYYTLAQGLEDTAVCNTLVDTALENLPGTDAQKTQIRTGFPGLGIDQTTTVVSDLCECTCTNRE